MKNSEKPAMPFHSNNPWSHESASGFSGLTKREHFAAMAMQGLLSNPEWMNEHEGKKYIMQDSVISEVAIKIADALLKELEGEK